MHKAYSLFPTCLICWVLRGAKRYIKRYKLILNDHILGYILPILRFCLLTIWGHAEVRDEISLKLMSLVTTGAKLPSCYESKSSRC